MSGFAPHNGPILCASGESRKTLTVPEIVTSAARLSGFEDFRARTLSALPGLWAKLLYMGGLRSQDGSYQHWGHSRVHGRSQSQASLAQVHSELFVEVLRTPIRDLAGELEEVGIANQLKLVARDGAQMSRLVPVNLYGGSRSHFSSVVLAARLVNENR